MIATIKLKTLIKIIIIIFIFNLFVVSGIQRFLCSDLKETELFLKLHKNFIWKFKKC
jgi:hypothetical protein